jgi:hypothetical protein
MKKFLHLFFCLVIISGLGFADESKSAAQGNSIPRPEYPRPQFARSSWKNLNGTWTFSFDFGKSGKERDFASSQGFEGKITVPFCLESPLSGVDHKILSRRYGINAVSLSLKTGREKR